MYLITVILRDHWVVLKDQDVISCTFHCLLFKLSLTSLCILVQYTQQHIVFCEAIQSHDECPVKMGEKNQSARGSPLKHFLIILK